MRQIYYSLNKKSAYNADKITAKADCSLNGTY